MVREPNQQKSHKKTKGVINDKFASNKKKIYLLKRTLQKKKLDNRSKYIHNFFLLQRIT